MKEVRKETGREGRRKVDKERINEEEMWGRKEGRKYGEKEEGRCIESY